MLRAPQLGAVFSMFNSLRRRELKEGGIGFVIPFCIAFLKCGQAGFKSVVPNRK
jgi:hypothetical protein